MQQQETALKLRKELLETDPDLQEKLKGGPFRLAYLTERLVSRRAQLADSFSSTVNALANHLALNRQIAEKFFLGMDDVRKQGINLMEQRHGAGGKYHQKYHAVQVAYDTIRETERCFALHPLNSTLAQKEIVQQRIVRLIIIALAGAAAAWHDVVQGKKVKTLNEVISAVEFCEALESTLDKQDNFMAKLLEHQELIAGELIIDATFLDFQGGTAKPVVCRIEEHLAKNGHDKEEMSGDLTPFQLLLIAGKSLARSDASSGGLPHVEKENLIYKSLPKEDQATLKHFFDFLAEKGMDLRGKEDSFLQPMGQSMRMFLEEGQNDVS